MRYIFNNLAFKIGSIIILVEILVLAVLGYLYINRFSDQVDLRIESQVRLPGTLMNAGLLSYDSVADGETMRQLVGEELITGMVVGINNNVFYSLNQDDLGKNIANVPGVDATLLDVDDPRPVVVYRDGTVISVSPVFAVDGSTPRFFAYIQAGTAEAIAEKNELAWLFILGSLAAVFLTSGIIILSFRLIIFYRVHDLVSMVKRVEDGDLSARVKTVTSTDEIGSLQNGVNSMAAAIQFRTDKQRRAEEEIRKLNAELEQRVADRTTQLETANKELEAFSYSVSHDLRAPLRSIDGFSRILLEDYESALPSEAQRYLGLVRDNAQRMGNLISDLLTFSRLGRHSLKKQRIEPAGIAREVYEGFSTKPEGRDVEITIGDLPLCQADPALLRQVFANLLENALKFTRERDVAIIEVGCCEQEGEQVYFVKDNGAGFDMQYADKLFGVFQRLHSVEEYEGTGVGLATVERIIHRHGGRIWAEAEVNQGATFYFTLGGQT